MAPWDVSGTASRVTDSYRMLLDTIGLAFDERSAREGDRMQKAGMWLAVGFGLLACPAPRRRRRDLAALAAVAHFGPYPLPILISLYRLCSARELRDWRTAEETTSADSAVGAEELKRVLTTGQYDYLLGHEAELLELTPSDIRAKLTDVFHTCS